VIETPVAIAAARLGKMLTPTATAETLTPTATAETLTTEMARTEAAAHTAATSTESAAHVAATESATHMATAATESAAHMATAATESAAHMATAATTETATAAVTSTTTATSPAAARQRVSGQPPGESGSRSQNDHDLSHHCTTPSDATRVHSNEKSRPSAWIARIRSMTVGEDVVPSFRGAMRFIADQVHAIACTRPQPSCHNNSRLIASQREGRMFANVILCDRTPKMPRRPPFRSGNDLPVVEMTVVESESRMP
jgi:hypothetical protein